MRQMDGHSCTRTPTFGQSLSIMWPLGDQSGCGAAGRSWKSLCRCLYMKYYRSGDVSGGRHHHITRNLAIRRAYSSEGEVGHIRPLKQRERDGLTNGGPVASKHKRKAFVEKSAD